MITYIRADAAEALAVVVVDFSGDLVTGLTSLRARVRRVSDGFIFDWSDNTFKAGASTVTPLGTLLEVDATYDPGHYALSWPGAAAGTYEVTITQTGTDGANLPASITLKVGGLGALDASSVAALVWGEALPGAYGAGTGGALLPSRSSHSAAAVWSVGTRELTGIGSSGIATAASIALLPSAAAIADAAWDELLSGHVGAGSAGAALTAAGALAPPSAAVIADAVWDELLAGHAGAGAAGAALALVDVAVSTRATAAAVWATAEGSPVAGTYGYALKLARQQITNRLVATAGSSANLVLYADDGTTPLKTWSVTDGIGGAVTTPAGSPARRAAAT